jgi:putative transposase
MMTGRSGVAPRLPTCRSRSWSGATIYSACAGCKEPPRLGPGVRHRTSRHKNNHIEQDHRGIKQRYYPMRGFGTFASAARFCTGFEEQRQYFRAVSCRGERVSLSERRRRFQGRWAAVMAELAAA